MSRSPRAWNHNTHHHRTLLELLPPHPKAALDIGCGDGAFAALLAQRCDTVVAMDLDPAQVEATRLRCATLPNVRVEEANFLTLDSEVGQFDSVTALASFHHAPFEAGAAAVQRILRPGGRLVVLGVWTDRRTAWDVVMNLVPTALNLVLRLLRGPDHVMAPARMPTMTMSELRRAAQQALPGVRIKRRALWRYTMIWEKPVARWCYAGVPQAASRRPGRRSPIALNGALGDMASQGP